MTIGTHDPRFLGPFVDLVAAYGVPNDGSSASAEISAALADLSARGRFGWLQPGDYGVDAPIVVPAGTVLWGAGAARTFLRAAPGVSPLAFAPLVFGRSELAYFTVLGDAVAPPPIGIDLDRSQANSVHDVDVFYFQIGIRVSGGGVFSGYNEVRRNRISGCPTGVQSLANSNGNQIHSNRINSSFTAANGGVGIDIADSAALLCTGNSVDGADVCIRDRNTSGVLSKFGAGNFLEPGVNPITAAVGRAFDTLVLPQIDGNESVYSFADSISANDSDVDLNPQAYAHTDSMSSPFFGAAFDGAAQLKHNPVWNGRALYFDTAAPAVPGWISVGAPTMAPSATFVTGNRSVLITANAVPDGAGPAFRIPDAWIGAGNQDAWVVAHVRYQIPAGVTTATFAAQVGANTTQYVPNPLPANTWRVASFRVPVDPANRNGSVTIHPGAIGASVLVDAVWVSSGRYASAEEIYREGVELLPAPVRIFEQLAVVASPTAWGPIDLLNLPGVLAPPLNAYCTAPDNVVGAILSLRIQTDGVVIAGSDVLTQHHMLTLTVPASGPVPARTRRVYAERDLHPVWGTFVLRRQGAPFGAFNVAGQYLAGDASPSDISVDLDGWILA